MRPDNAVRPITFDYSLNGIPVNEALLQLFVDDFQAPAWGTQFQMELNGKRAPLLERIINSLYQEHSSGRLLTMQIPPDLLGEVASGHLILKIDDPETGAGDGYAIDFAKLLINPKVFRFAARFRE